MTDVREECSLRPVDVRQRFRAAPFLLIRIGIGDGGRYLPCHQPQKITISAVEQPERVEADDQDPAPTGFARRQQRQQSRLRRRLVPRPGGQRPAEVGGEVPYQHDFAAFQHLGERPRLPAAGRDCFRCRGMGELDARRRRQRQRLSVGLRHVKKHEWQIVQIRPKCRRSPGTHILRVAGVAGRRGEIAQQPQLAFADHPLGIVGIRTDDAAGTAVIVRNGTVRKGVVGLLLITVALHDQELLLDEGALDAPHGGGEQRPDVRPDLPPYLRRWPPQRDRMLAADDGLVGIVVEKGELPAPADPDRLPGRQHDAQRGFQALGPTFRRP